ncbi:hypothetical protein BWX40_02920 [Prevotella intermedia]|nr:hypothetical protein BWX40_02920 [Prevotella intermedia]
MQPSARWHGFGKPLTMLTAAVIATTALCFTACASSRKSVKSEKATSHEVNRLDVDSTASVVETWQTPVKVPMSAVSLTLSMDSLRLLPSGAGYTARKGQANVKVMRIPPTANEPEQLVIEAGCDSLELVCVRYSKTISSLKRQLKEVNKSNSELKEAEQEKTKNTFFMRLKYFFTGLLSGIAATVLTRFVIAYIRKKKLV